MISSFRNFAKTKFAGILVFIIIIPFVFWGMGGMFSSGNTNNVAEINNKKISTQEFFDFLNNSKIPLKTLQANLDKNIIEELLGGLISNTMIDLEIKDLNLVVSELTLLKKIKENKNFHDENGNFQRIVSSKPSSQITLEPGKDYYMDIYLEKSKDFDAKTVNQIRK